MQTDVVITEKDKMNNSAARCNMLKDRDTVRVSQARALLGRRRLVGSSSLYDARAGCRVQREGRGDVVGAGAES